MAWQYQIALECGSPGSDPLKCAALLGELIAGIEGAFVSRSVDGDGSPWVSANLPQNLVSAAEWENLSKPIWEAVLIGCPFRFGFCGLEVEHLRTYSELIEDSGIDWTEFARTAVSAGTWESLGRPDAFREVGNGVWVVGHE